ncbi:LysM peptidoglycan-binding domain-containing protein [Lentibacter sp.]|uniref:LysM peptidoglycan-binding domain-containing protein n=1 Tax=Lentibacter sp. TaxID=2024994 RepID=UPI003F6973DC
MSKLSGFMASNGAALAATVAVVLGLTGIGIVYKDQFFKAEPEPKLEFVIKPNDQPQPDIKAEEDAVSNTVSSGLAPKFDVARVEPDGQTLIAGAALPGEIVEVLLDGSVLLEVQAGTTGEFVAFAELSADSNARVLSLRGKTSGQESQNTIIIAPLQAKISGVAEYVAESMAGSMAREETAETPTETPVAVLLAGEDGVTVLQAAAAPNVMSQVALDAISYSDSGEVQLSGRATTEGFVRVYLDNRPIKTDRIEANGQWRSDLPDVETGIYTLRVDEVDAAGQVTSRVETPFKREEPDNLVQQGGATLVTVQPGATLWAIAQNRYGTGQLYVQLYEANKDQIRDPDLIFPGQVFDIPE